MILIPLKNKKILSDGEFAHYDIDIKSALDWYKKKCGQIDNHIVEFWDDELREIYYDYIDIYNYEPEIFKLWLLDIAFEDVIKK